MTINDEYGLSQIITQAINELKQKEGDRFDPQNVNLAELERMTGIPRHQLRRMQQYGFEDLARHSGGNRKKYQVLQGFTDILDTLLKQGISNSSVCLDRLRESGYPGSLTTVKRYIAEHRDLIPAKRQLVAPQGSRGRRYHTGPGE